MTERCAPPQCVRRIGHAGECRPVLRGQPCGAWMPQARTFCARARGHRGYAGGHRTRWAMDNALRAERRRIA